MKKEIILIGGGGHCKSCIDVIEQEGKYKIAGILDKKEKLGEEVCGVKVIGTDDDIPYFQELGTSFLITVGQIRSVETRRRIGELFFDKQNLLAKIISPNAYVSKNSEIGFGTIVMHGAVINTSVTIGKNCIINSQALVEHDSSIKDFCHISTGAIVNGSVEVGECSFVGSGSIIIQNSIITPYSFIKAGTIYKA